MPPYEENEDGVVADGYTTFQHLRDLAETGDATLLPQPVQALHNGCLYGPVGEGPVVYTTRALALLILTDFATLKRNAGDSLRDAGHLSAALEQYELAAAVSQDPVDYKRMLLCEPFLSESRKRRITAWSEGGRSILTDAPPEVPSGPEGTNVDDIVNLCDLPDGSVVDFAGFKYTLGPVVFNALGNERTLLGGEGGVRTCSAKAIARLVSVPTPPKEPVMMSFRAFVYHMLRDCVPAGEIERWVQDIEKNPPPWEFSNKHLAAYATEICERLSKVAPSE
jgi:hypothetical protein